MKISSSQLISELTTITQQHIQYVETLLQKTDQELNHKTSENSWSVLECIEHLNLYGDFYIPEITHRISSSHSTTKTTFSPGILGNYFAKSMLPKEKLNTMKTFKTMNPIRAKLDKGVLKKFIWQEQQLLVLLEKSRNINLEKTKTSISISKLIKLKLGDTLRFVIYHNVRHIEQTKKVLLAV
ncbi:DinB family protein [Chryseobacterium sp. ISL-6]|uniref:DinB family protein n=1 Tax=Chryseobacterium sp. ISL-6 TaxID=2819143 RepID=UPI001BED36F8|nr:DinB family protein [Chryseobacterium sp. ISL-6]MBT2623227.1 DinB family protein [Chryseobacterium sp. ISL-6]